MTRKLRGFGLVLIGAALIGAAAAPAAEAGPGEFRIFPTPGVFTAQQQVQQLVFGVSKGFTFFCTTATFEGETHPQAVTEIAVTPAFSGCRYRYETAEANVTIKVNGCKFTFTGGVAERTFNLGITGCTPGKTIEAIVGGCTFKFGVQGPVAHTTATNVPGPPQHLFLAYAIPGGIQYQEVGLLCPDPNGTVGNNGSLTGVTTVKGFLLQGQALRTVGTHQFAESLCGSQVELFAT